MKRWLWLACAALSGCRTASFVPETPRSATTAGTRVKLEQVRVTRSLGESEPLLKSPVTLSVRLSGEGLQQLREVSLNSAYADGCDGETAVVRRSAGQLTASWTVRDVSFFWGPTTVDVGLATADGSERCLRLLLSSDLPEGALREAGRSEWFLITRLDLEVATSPVTANTTLVMLGSGTWLGPARISFLTGVGSGRCSDETCPREGDEPKQLASGLTLPIDVEAELAVVRRHTSSLGLALRPGLRVSWFRTAAPEPRHVAFTPALVLRYWQNSPLPLRAFVKPHRQEGWGAAVEAPLGLWQDLDGTQPLGWYGGLGIVIVLPAD